MREGQEYQIIFIFIVCYSVIVSNQDIFFVGSYKFLPELSSFFPWILGGIVHLITEWKLYMEKWFFEAW